MIKVQCVDCSYAFTAKESRLPKRCPYCSKEGSVQRIKQMQEWIDEVGDLSENFISTKKW
jgi:predicted Zn-ribbon and HTH transcriptional regulator